MEVRCIKCLEILSKISLSSGFDVFSFGNFAYYCNNKDCEHYGLVTLACITKEDNK